MKKIKLTLSEEADGVNITVIPVGLISGDLSLI